MSKASLKKELSSFDREQLVEIIMAAYSSSKEAKEYFEFFLNPDVDALYEKKLESISKELARNKYGQSKARISHIRAAIKNLENFGVGPEHVARLMADTLKMMVAAERYYRFMPAMINGSGRLVKSLLEYCDKNGMISFALEEIDKIVRNTSSGRPYFRNFIASQAADFEKS